MSRHGLVFAACLASATALAALTGLTAEAGPPGSWTRVTDANGRNIDQIGLARTGDRVLHVFWKRRDAPLSESVRHTAVTPAGRVGDSSLVLGDINSVGDPDAIVLRDGRLQVFFPGLGDTNPEGGVMAATGSAAGTAWRREGVRVSSTSSALSSVGAALSAGGEPVFAFTRSFLLAFHVGLDPGAGDRALQPDTRCCDYMADLATDASTGQTAIAWYSNADGREGVWAQPVLPGTGARSLVPGTVTRNSSVGVDQRVAISARLGAPGLYVAACQGYPVCTRTVLWRLGGRPLMVGRSSDVEDVHLSTGPEGRLWIAWHDGRTRRIHAVRTNKAASRVGPVVTVAPPRGTSSMWKLTGEGAPGPLDLFVSATTGSSLATWHTQVLPPLSARATRGGRTVTFTVTDAGDPVSGARISYAGRTLTTSAQGTATTQRSSRSVSARVAKAGYRPATLPVRR